MRRVKFLNLISTADLQRIEEHLTRSLDRLLAVDADRPAHVQPLIERLRAYVLRGGKRVRPQLCVWAFENQCDEPIGENLLDVACAWEVFHAFLLVHDDVIDVADTRRQTPSLHRQLQSLDQNSAKFGENLAIVSGDLLFGIAIRLLAEMKAEPSIQLNLIQLFSRIACTTGFGQVIDLFQSKQPLETVSEQILLCEYDWKTAAYTFEGPLLSGAMLAGASMETQAVISRVARAIGQAYQLHNDLADLTTPAHEGCDLVQGKRTFTLMRARSLMSEDKQQQLDEQVRALASANGQAVRLAEALRQELCSGGAVEQTQAVISQLLSRAKRAAGSSECDVRFSKSLLKLVDLLEQHYFGPVSLAVPGMV